MPLYLSQYIIWFSALYLHLKYFYFFILSTFKYSCTNIFFRRGLYIFYNGIYLILWNCQKTLHHSILQAIILFLTLEVSASHICQDTTAPGYSVKIVCDWVKLQRKWDDFFCQTLTCVFLWSSRKMVQVAWLKCHDESSHCYLLYFRTIHSFHPRVTK